jgi:quinol monooxygenase YgiN
MDDSKPVTAIFSFRLLPGFRESWVDAWRRLRDAALSEPTCRQFRLLRDQHHEAQYVVFSEWDRASDFDAFIREAGVIWLVSALDGTSEPPAYSILEAIPFEADLATQERTRELIPVD